MGSSVDENQDTTTGSQTEQSRSKLLFVKVTEHASTPTKGSKYSAGYDLKSAYDVIVPKRGSAVVKTDIQIQLPHGTYGRIAPRSGLAVKNKIDVGAGVVDEDYRGNLGVVLFNHGDEDFQVEKGDRIAQLICEKIEYPEILEVENLEVSDRGHNGFGSTGVKKIKLDGDVDVKSRETGEECAELQPKEVTMDVESGEVAVSVSSPVKEVKIGILSPSKLQPTAGTD